MTTPQPLPAPDDSSAPFWEAARRHELVAQRCVDCRAWRHPPQPRCAGCMSDRSAFEPVSGTGHVWSFVVAHPPVLPAFADRAPYAVAVVELDERIRMVGNVFGVEPARIAIGMRVVVTFEDVDDDVSLPQWRPA